MYQIPESNTWVFSELKIFKKLRLIYSKLLKFDKKGDPSYKKPIIYHEVVLMNRNISRWEKKIGINKLC